jgi:hypothetical protein
VNETSAAVVTVGDAGELLYANFHPKPGQAAAAPPKGGTAFQTINPKPPGPTVSMTILECETKINNQADEISKRIDSMTSEISMAKKQKPQRKAREANFQGELSRHRLLPRFIRPTPANQHNANV